MQGSSIVFGSYLYYSFRVKFIQY